MQTSGILGGSPGATPYTSSNTNKRKQPEQTTDTLTFEPKKTRTAGSSLPSAWDVVFRLANSGSTEGFNSLNMNVNLSTQQDEQIVGSKNEIVISSDQLKNLKKLVDYFDKDTILATRTLHEEVSDDGKNTGYAFCPTSDDQLNKLRFIVEHLEQWENKNFESSTDFVRFISNVLEFKPKPQTKKEAIKHFSECIPQITQVYIDLLPIVGKQDCNKTYSPLLSHAATIFQQPGMIHKVLNQMNFSNCSEQTIATMATLFFSDLDEINLEIKLSNNQFMALISGINAIKEEKRNATPIRKIVLGNNVTCNNDAVLALAKKSKDLSCIAFGRNVTCNDATLKFLAERSENLNHIFLGNNVTCNNATLEALAKKVKDLKSLYLGYKVTCNNDAVLALAEKAKDLNCIWLGDNVTCNNDAVLALAQKTKNLTCIALGRNVTCNDATVMALAKKVKNLNRLFLGDNVTCNNATIMALVQKARGLKDLYLGRNVEIHAPTQKRILNDHQSLTKMYCNNQWLFRGCYAEEQKIVTLVEKLSDSDTMVVINTAKEIETLTAKYKNSINVENTLIPKVVEAGAIPKLVRLLSHYEPDVQECAVGILVNLANKNPKNKTKIAEEGGLIPLTNLLTNLLTKGTNKGKINAFYAICDLGGFNIKDGLRDLITLLTEGHDVVKEKAAGRLAGLASFNKDNQTKIVEEDVFPPLITLLATGTDAQKQSAACAIVSLGYKNSANKTKTVEAGALKPLVDLLGNGTYLAKWHASVALENLEKCISGEDRETAIQLLSKLNSEIKDHGEENLDFLNVPRLLEIFSSVTWYESW